MQLVAALALLNSVLRMISEIASATNSANGAKIAAMLNAIMGLSQQAQSAADLIRQALEQGRTELTDDERNQLRQMDDQARQLQVSALQTPSTFERPEATRGKDAGLAAAHKAGAGGRATKE